MLAVQASHPAATYRYLRLLYVVLGQTAGKETFFMKQFKELYLDSLKEFKRTKTIVVCGMMAALAIVLGLVATIQIGNYVRIGFSGLPNRIVDFLFGPVVGCFFGGALDVLKYIIKPTGPYNIGFTISAMASGIIYGSLLYKKPVSLKRIVLAEFLVKFFINCLLNTYWLSILYGNAFTVLFPLRALKNLIMWPIDCAILYVTLTLVAQILPRVGFHRTLSSAG
jgi:ECF transporter S component (folate family)